MRPLQPGTEGSSQPNPKHAKAFNTWPDTTLSPSSPRSLNSSVEAREHYPPHRHTSKGPPTSQPACRRSLLTPLAVSLQSTQCPRTQPARRHHPKQLAVAPRAPRRRPLVPWLSSDLPNVQRRGRRTRAVPLALISAIGSTAHRPNTAICCRPNTAVCCRRHRHLPRSCAWPLRRPHPSRQATTVPPNVRQRANRPPSHRCRLLPSKAVRGRRTRAGKHPTIHVRARRGGPQALRERASIRNQCRVSMS
jgi:hypothetical protein